MSFAPISFIASNYSSYATWWLKAYEPATSTPKTMALNSDGSTLAIKVQLNAAGFPESAGGAIVIPYISGSYDLFLFPTAAEADANSTINALRLADNISADGTSGGTSILPEEIVTLIAGQTVVTFTGIFTSTASIFIGSTGVDRGRLIKGIDYTVTGDLTILLASSYPAGTLVVAVSNEVSSGGGGSGGSSLKASVAAMIASSPSEGSGCQTISYILDEIGGGAVYLIKSAADAATDGDIIDELTNHTCDNTNIAVLQHDGVVDFRMSGGRVYDAGSPIDNSAALLAAIAQSFTVLIVGDYYFSVAVDLSTLSDPGNPRSQVIGTRNKNVDGTDSQLTFDGTSGITVTAGCKIEDLEIRNIGSMAGTGLHLADVHSSSVRNVTITNFTRGAYIFAFQSRLEMIIAYQCETGLEFYGECTSLTVQSCWARSGTYGFIIGRLVAYSTFLNCAVDDVFVPYTVAGDNVHLDQCGAEINLDYYNVSIGNTDYATDYITEIEGYIRFDSSAGGASTVTVSGGRYIMVPTPADSPEPEHTYTTETAVYSVPAANNESSVVAFSRMTSNSFANVSDSFIMGKLRAVIDDSCTFTDVFPLKVKDGDFGSIMMDGRSSATLRRHAKATSYIGSSQNDAQASPNNLAIIIEEIIDFQAVLTAGDEVFIKSSLLNSDSNLQFTVEMWPRSATGNYASWAGWSFGSSSRHGSDIVGSGFGFTGNDASNFQNFYFDRTAIQGLAFVRITAAGWPDSSFRDRLITLTVGPDDA